MESCFMKLWWAYLNIDEKIHIKRYTTDRAIRNAEESGTTIGIFEVFEARDIEQASHMILEKYREVRYIVKSEEKRIIT
jgi:hypothetical protein